MTFLTVSNHQISISRKIWAAENLLNFHPVPICDWKLMTNYFLFCFFIQKRLRSTSFERLLGRNQTEYVWKEFVQVRKRGWGSHATHSNWSITNGQPQSFHDGSQSASTQNQSGSNSSSQSGKKLKDFQNSKFPQSNRILGKG